MIDAKDFFEKFIDKLNIDQASALEKYYYNKEWTNYLNEAIKCILKNEYNLKTSQEYFRVDMIGWNGKEEWNHEAHKKYNNQDKLKLIEYYWNLEIAVEYENNPHEWMDELIKLCHVKCGLKVLIAYSDYKKREWDLEKLSKAANHINKLAYAQPLINEQLLIIIGNCGKEEYNNLDDIGFKAYIYSDKVFKLLEI